jgi:hypothetical protein
MFIDTAKPWCRAPAERNVSVNGRRDRLTFRSAGARSFLAIARSINLSSLGDEEGCCEFESFKTWISNR